MLSVVATSSSESMHCLVVFSLTLLVIYLFPWSYRKLSPPVPWGLPILGHLPLLGKNPAKTLMEYSKVYGDVFKIRMGSWPTIVLNSKDAIHEALLGNSEIFSDRPEFFSAKTLDSKMKSLAFGSYTPRWRLHRKVAVHVLREHASPKNTTAINLIEKELGNLLTSFIERKGSSFNPNDDIFQAIGCIIFQLCFGDVRNCREDEQFLEFIRSTKDFVETAGAGNPLDVMPWLRFVMPWKARQLEHNVNLNKMIVSSEIQKHAQTFDKYNQRDVTDGLNAAAEHYSSSSHNNHGITSEDILSTLQDFIGAGFETVSTTLEWILLYLAFYKDVQRLVQKEIHTALGTRKPTFEDRKNLPYTEATILEVMRLANVVPMALPHATTKDVVFRDFEIEKGTVVLCNNYAVARDERIWKNPGKFCPNRFLDKNNGLIREKIENVLTFGLGRRRCPGEVLAKMELFLFVTSIFQRFNVSLSSDANFDCIFGLTCKPLPYEINIENR